MLYIALAGTIPEIAVIHRMVNGVDSFPLLAIPFFIMAGNLMNTAGITERIFDFAKACVGWLHGGLGHVNVAGIGDLRRHVRARRWPMPAGSARSRSRRCATTATT